MICKAEKKRFPLFFEGGGAIIFQIHVIVTELSASLDQW